MVLKIYANVGDIFNKVTIIMSVVLELKNLLADTYTLYLKTQYYHWNMKGQNFYSVHKMLEEQYEELALTIDEVAEQISMLGYIAPGSFSEFEKVTEISPPSHDISFDTMLHDLLKSHEVIYKRINISIKKVDKEGDEVVHDLLVGQLAKHRKFMWLLSSHV